MDNCFSELRVAQRSCPTVCLLLVVQILTGCAGMSEEQKTGTVGAGIGAVVGTVTGALADKKHPAQAALIGGTAGALVGALAGWAVGAYQVSQVKTRDQAAAAVKYTPQQGVVTNIDRIAATPPQLKPGDQLTFQSQYTVLGPIQNNQITVRETRTIFFNDQPLGELGTRDIVLNQGTNDVQYRLTLPQDAADGAYRMVTTVEPVAVPNPRKEQASTAFVVSGGGGKPAVSHPGASASLTPEAGRPPGMPQVVYVKNQIANLREGAGVSFHVITTAPRGAALTVIGESGPAQNRWYKVKLAGGREAWVAASVVSLNP